MKEDLDFIKTYIETMLLSCICEQDTIEGNGKISALRQVLMVIKLREDKEQEDWRC